MLNETRNSEFFHTPIAGPAFPLGRVIPSQMTIYHQGDPFVGVYRVNSGVVMVYRLLDNCDRQIFGFYTTGEYFGMSTDSSHQDAAVTVTTANVSSVKMADVLRDTKLQQRLLQATCEQLREAQNRITILTRKSASEKMAYFLVKLAESHKETEECFDLDLPMSRLDIADYLGLSVETVSRRLTAMKMDQVISLPNRDTIRVCQFTRLKELAGAP